MAIANKFIHFNTKAGFLNKIKEYVTYNSATNTYTPLSGKTDDWNMFKNYTCFIKDSQEIWTHEQFYGRVDKFAESKLISLTGDVNGSSMGDFENGLDINCTINNVNANTIKSGTISTDRLPSIPLSKLPIEELNANYVPAVSPINPDTDGYGEIKNTATSISLNYNGSDPSEVLVSDSYASLSCSGSYVSVDTDYAKIGYGQDWGVFVDYSGSVNIESAAGSLGFSSDMSEMGLSCGTKRFILSDSFNGVNFGFEAPKGIIYKIFNADVFKEYNGQTITTTEFITGLGATDYSWYDLSNLLFFSHAIRMQSTDNDETVVETVNIRAWGEAESVEWGAVLTKVIFSAKTWKAVVTISNNNLIIKYYDFSTCNITNSPNTIVLTPGAITNYKSSLVLPIAVNLYTSLTEDVDECIFIINGTRKVSFADAYASSDIPLIGSSTNSVRVYYFKRVQLYANTYGTIVNCTEYIKS